MANWQDYWKKEGQQKNQDLLDMLRARGGVYDRQNLGRIRAEEKMSQQRGTGVGAEYNPILGKPMVKDALGGVNSADWNIGGNIASGTPVQLMGRGFGIVADAKPSKQGGDALSTGNQADRTGSLPTGFNFDPGSTDDSGSEDAWIAGPDGSCELKNYAKGKAPAGSFKSLEECRKAQDSEYNCVSGEGCKAVAKGTGKYKTLAECKAALIPASFTGGQCPGVRYTLRIPVRYLAFNPTPYPDQDVYGPVSSVTLEQFTNELNIVNVRIRIVARDALGGVLNYAVGGYPGTVSQYSIPAWTPIPQTAEPIGGCGNPPGQCPI